MLEPLGPRVLVKLDEEVSSTRKGILIPDSARKPPAFGTVIACGDWERDYPEIEIGVGDHVLVNKYGGQSVKYGEQELLILHIFNDVLAIETDGAGEPADRLDLLTRGISKEAVEEMKKPDILPIPIDLTGLAVPGTSRGVVKSWEREG